MLEYSAYGIEEAYCLAYKTKDYTASNMLCRTFKKLFSDLGENNEAGEKPNKNKYEDISSQLDRRKLVTFNVPFKTAISEKVDIAIVLVVESNQNAASVEQ